MSSSSLPRSHSPTAGTSPESTSPSGPMHPHHGAHAAHRLNVLPEAMHSPEAQYFARISANPLADAFSRKTTVHAGMSGTPVPPADIPEILKTLRATGRSGPTAAYVHLPYCESKCLYCGFFGGKYSKDAGAAYVDALIREIISEKDYTSVTSAPVNALYLGGGTPTALQAHELSRLLRTLREVLPLANDCEITVEGRIHHFGEEKLEACLEAGANRFSLGVQSFQTEMRRRLGRIASKEEVISRLRALAAYNQAAIIIDLIYGLPGQTLEDWEEDLLTFLDLPLDGVDLYQLNIFPGNSLAQAIDAGRVPPVAPLAEQGRLFERGVQLMQQSRSRRLSMSHWGRSSRERNLYNPMAKSKADCLHYGAGAGGLLQGWFMYNQSDPEQYIQKCNSGEKPVAMVTAPSADLPVMRVILEQMELCRVNLDDVSASLAGRNGEKQPSRDAYALYEPLLDNWRQAGLITQDGPWVELTLAGQFWQVTLAQALISWQRRMSNGAECRM